MFVSISSSSRTPTFHAGLWHYKYWILDSESVIEEEYFGACDQTFLSYTEVRCGAVIAYYFDRGANVPYNLALYHKYMQKTYSWYKLEDEIKYNIEHTPGYKHYVEDTKKMFTRLDNLMAFL